MDFKTQVFGSTGLAGELATVRADALLVVVCGTTVPEGLPGALAAMLKGAIAAGDVALKSGQILYLHQPAGIKATRLVFAVAADASAKAFRKAVAAGLAVIKGGGTRQLAVAMCGGKPGSAHAEALAASVHEAVYLYRHTKPSATAASKLSSVTMLCDKDTSAAVTHGLKQGAAIAAGTDLARECANLPANQCTPSYLAAQARQLSKEFGLKVEVLDRKDAEKLGMGAFLAVAQGSAEPPKFIVARYLGAGKSVAPVVLVGKGITFDTGGISIKPAGEMDEMKFDMGGAASVLGTLRAVALLKAKVNLIGIIVATENMPGGRAVKPGDVVTSLSGQTIEILNTDAEGRLVLCDALTYAERFKPAVVVDIATLTGACVVALGHHRSGLFSADDALAAELLAAGDEAQDPAWRMPLDEEYDEALKSNFADMANVGSTFL